MSLPTPPLRSDGPTSFADRGDTFMAALPAFEAEMNAIGVIAAEAIVVSSSAIAAANFKGEYAAGTTYQVGQSVSYGGDTWFAKTVNIGVTPVAGIGWQRVTSIPNQTGNAGKVLVTDGTTPSWSSTLASPVLTGTPTAPTAAIGTNSTQVATTAFVQEARDDAMFFALAF